MSGVHPPVRFPKLAREKRVLPWARWPGDPRRGCTRARMRRLRVSGVVAAGARRAWDVQDYRRPPWAFWAARGAQNNRVASGACASSRVWWSLILVGKPRQRGRAAAQPGSFARCRDRSLPPHCASVQLGAAWEVVPSLGFPAPVRAQSRLDGCGSQ